MAIFPDKIIERVCERLLDEVRKKVTRRLLLQTPERAFERGCKNKIRHPTEEAALLALDSIKRSKGCKRKTKLTVYKCKFGEHYHVGRRRRNWRTINDTT